MPSTVLRQIALRGLRRGVSDGSRAWMVVGVAAGLAILARRVLDEEPELLAREVLDPGERLVVSVAPPDIP